MGSPPKWDLYTLLHHYPVWEEWLRGDFDRVYLLNTILNGLWISEHGSPVKPFALPNYTSVRDHILQLHQNLAPELLAGRVVQVNSVQYANAVGLIPKSHSLEMRRITDLSRPKGSSVNDSVPDRHFRFQTLEVALSMMSQNCFMAIVDIRHAYRHIVIRPEDWDLQSFRVGDLCFQDRCLSFGLKIAPEVFTRFSQAVLRIMRSHGFHNAMAYLDEFFVTGNWTQVWKTFCHLIYVLRQLGFYIHWGKVLLPARERKFLGFMLDSVQMTVSVPPDKMEDARSLITQALSSAWLPIKVWQRLIGKLNFMAKAIYGGRTFLRRVIDLAVRLDRCHNKGSRVTKEAAADLHWWLLFMEQWNGKALILDGRKILANQLTSDASDKAVGAVYHHEVIYLPLSPQQIKWHINVKELFAFLVAIREWGSTFQRKHLKFIPRLGAQLDSVTALTWINKGSSKSKPAMKILRELFWRSATQGFRVTCSHIPGKKNVIADAASRLEFHRIPPQFRVRQARSLSAQEVLWIERLSSF